jgi:hypothetical protein
MYHVHLELIDNRLAEAYSAFAAEPLPQRDPQFRLPNSEHT